MVAEPAELVDRDDSRVLELAADLRLLDEPADQLGVVAVLLEQDLDRQVAAQVVVTALEDGTHAAAGDLAQELIAVAAMGRRGHLRGCWPDDGTGDLGRPGLSEEQAGNRTEPWSRVGLGAQLIPLEGTGDVVAGGLGPVAREPLPEQAGGTQTARRIGQAAPTSTPGSWLDGASAELPKAGPLSVRRSIRPVSFHDDGRKCAGAARGLRTRGSPSTSCPARSGMALAECEDITLNPKEAGQFRRRPLDSPRLVAYTCSMDSEKTLPEKSSCLCLALRQASRTVSRLYDEEIAASASARRSIPCSSCFAARAKSGSGTWPG